MRTDHRPALVLVPMLALLLLVGCETNGRFVSDWGEITLAPGDTGSCRSNPCRVFFEMPPGSGSYRVTGTGFTIGEFPAGRRVSLGSFFESSAIKVVGADVPKAYIYVPGTTSNMP
ncbi:hypothetical protein F2Q65_00295 [Thiohalocapsa marina]|uniref:Lipoprotein n=1 Tax=Thiohalocapsa marina TaxID=424902 RepID=A0A5M8FV85_9GAMM|nr:hypothetical protein [Thiohalocapsa marina]KAA6187720.1 hypothetical protein F2Q65_00295 [Thiohalocapsa marina]